LCNDVKFNDVKFKDVKFNDVKFNDVKINDVPDNSDVNIEAAKIKEEKWSPVLWREQLESIREMRKHRDAPVDTMGCERCHDHDAEPQVKGDRNGGIFSLGPLGEKLDLEVKSGTSRSKDPEIGIWTFRLKVLLGVHIVPSLQAMLGGREGKQARLE
jgi:hypothetical protein